MFLIWRWNRPCQWKEKFRLKSDTQVWIFPRFLVSRAIDDRITRHDTADHRVCLQSTQVRDDVGLMRILRINIAAHVTRWYRRGVETYSTGRNVASEFEGLLLACSFFRSRRAHVFLEFAGYFLCELCFHHRNQRFPSCSCDMLPVARHRKRPGLLSCSVLSFSSLELFGSTLLVTRSMRSV